MLCGRHGTVVRIERTDSSPTACARFEAVETLNSVRQRNEGAYEEPGSDGILQRGTYIVNAQAPLVHSQQGTPTPLRRNW